jgi:hypothetical protein
MMTLFFVYDGILQDALFRPPPVSLASVALLYFLSYLVKMRYYHKCAQVFT